MGRNNTGEITNTIKHDEQVEVVIERPGRYTFDVRDIPAKAKTLVIIRTNRRIDVSRQKSRDECPIKPDDIRKLLFMKKNETRREDDRFFADCLYQLADYLEKQKES